ncbi:MAG: hypothetical protein NZ811_08800 [Gammaproteobacteria bacterium]|nr:hypothetical protein [Gammaproteobacteria bacterium]
MQVNCKKCGKDVTGNVNEFFEGVRKSPNCDEKNCSAKRLQEKIAKDFTLIDYMSVNTVKQQEIFASVKDELGKFIDDLSRKNGTTKY